MHLFIYIPGAYDKQGGGGNGSNAALCSQHRCYTLGKDAPQSAEHCVLSLSEDYNRPVWWRDNM